MQVSSSLKLESMNIHSAHFNFNFNVPPRDTFEPFAVRNPSVTDATQRAVTQTQSLYSMRS